MKDVSKAFVATVFMWQVLRFWPEGHKQGPEGDKQGPESDERGMKMR